MMIFPSMEVKDGKCVSLRRGRIEEPLVWHVDPLVKAREFAAAGAPWMHLTDIDAVLGSDVNRELVVNIIRHVGIPVQLAGGIRSIEIAKEWVELGAGRLVVGTLAVLRPELVKTAAKLFPDQIVVAVDIWQGKVMIHGWNEPSSIAPQDLISEYWTAPLAGFVVTDIDSNIEDTDNTMEILSSLSKATRTPVIASGVVRTIQDIGRLKQFPNVVGTLVGTSLFNRTLDLREAIEAARPGAKYSFKAK